MIERFDVVGLNKCGFTRYDILAFFGPPLAIDLPECQERWSIDFL